MPITGGGGGGEPPFSFEEDAGANQTLIDMSVSATPGAGTEESYHLMVDGQSFIELYSEANGAGGLQNEEVRISKTLSVEGGKDLDFGAPGSDILFNNDASIYRGGNEKIRFYSDRISIREDVRMEAGNIFHYGLVQSAQPAPTQNFFTFYIDTDDDHLYCVWDDGGVTKTLDLGQLT